MINNKKEIIISIVMYILQSNLMEKDTGIACLKVNILMNNNNKYQI